METKPNRKTGVRPVCDPKKPWLWIILGAVLCCAAAAICLLILPKTCRVRESSRNTDPVPVAQWFDCRDKPDQLSWDSRIEKTVDAFPGVTFRMTGGSVEAVGNGRTRTLFSGMPIESVYAADVTGDGKPDLCAAVYFGSGIVDEHIIVYDYLNKQSYVLWDRMQFDYHLYMADGALYVGKTPYGGDKQTDMGTIGMHDGVLSCQSVAGGAAVPLGRMLHESELYGEWLVQKETDNDGNVLYTFALDLWKEYDFKEDGTVVYNETVPISSDSELAFGHPESHPYEVHDGYVYIDADGDSGFFRWGNYDPQTDTLHLMYDTPDGTVDAELTRMGGDLS